MREELLFTVFLVRILTPLPREDQRVIEADVRMHQAFEDRVGEVAYHDRATLMWWVRKETNRVQSMGPPAHVGGR
jgi:hypothetical protein